MVLFRASAAIVLVLVFAWVHSHGAETSKLWTWHDAGAYEACVGAGGSPDVGNVLRHHAVVGPMGFAASLDGLWLRADGTLWSMDSGWTTARSVDTVDSTQGLADATQRAIISYADGRATFDAPLDPQALMDDLAWTDPGVRTWGAVWRADPWEARFTVPECAVAPGGRPLPQLASNEAVLWITPDDQVQGVLPRAGTVGDALAAMGSWYGDWREPRFDGLQPVTWMWRPGPW